MAVNITYFVHGTTTDNEQGIATGQNPGELSALGKKQSIELREQIKDLKIDIVFCSDLKRAVDSARLTWKNSLIIMQDKNLRECNYGDFNGGDVRVVDSMTLKFIDRPFPNGESYKDVEKRMKTFCKRLLGGYNNKNVAIVAHRGPQLALDVIIKGKSWKEAIAEDWRHRKAWQPGWNYKLGD